MPPYGGSIAQNVYYAESTLCDADVDTTVGYPEREIDSKTKKMKPWPSPYILMVDRGDCTFVKKVSFSLLIMKQQVSIVNLDVYYNVQRFVSPSLFINITR